ncbi:MULTISPECIES: hypothetical protein [Paracoccus]|uniref:hypothetical protein n=1 Tax=Paracoccus TaxID=265 RepID=UPI001FB81595|nr:MULTISPECIES: hypothetical protein [Paracoccus]MCJ1902882.1 hypothetical protein [Paracoccus versutus]MDF3907403.1 hypothetical protein [Paracoccus sp. AS002]
MAAPCASLTGAGLLYWPEATPPWPATRFGPLRPAHATGILFGFGGNALIAALFHVVQRNARAAAGAPGCCCWATTCSAAGRSRAV